MNKIKKCLKILINASFCYIFTKPNWPATPWSPHSTKIFLTFLQTYPHLLEFTYKVNPKTQTPRKVTQTLPKVRQALLVMLVTYRMYVCLVYLHT